MIFFKRDINHTIIKAAEPQNGAKASLLLACGYASLFLVVAPFFVSGQNNENIDVYYSRLVVSRVSEFKISQPPRYLNFLPSIGTTNIIVDGRLRVTPSLSFSLSQLVRDRREKSRLSAKINSIKLKTQLEKENDLRKIKRLEDKLKLVNSELKLKKELLQIREKIYKYDSIRYAKNEINPDSYYNSLISIMNERHSIKVIEQKLSDVVGDIRQLYRYE